MDILKNIYLNFNFLKSGGLVNFFLILILLLIKFILIFFFKKINITDIIIYLKNFIKKTISKKYRKIILIFSNLIFFNILIYNLIDLFPLNLIKTIFNFSNLEIVPTSDINITFSLSLISFIIINYISIKKIGIINFFLNFTKHPIKNKYMILFNFIIEFISFIMKPLSLSLRLFGNIFASDIIFNLISSMDLLFNSILNLMWGIFHYLILPLQSFIFITLVIIYLSQSLKI